MIIQVIAAKKGGGEGVINGRFIVISIIRTDA